MKYIPFKTIKAAQDYDSEAIACILKHFERFIADESKEWLEDTEGRAHFCIDDDLHYLGVIGLFSAIFKFQFREPPDDFIL